jgi:predicted RNA-binding protein
MARRRTTKKGKTTYGKPFSKKSTSGKFKKGTKIQYKYVNGRRVGARKARK